MLTLTDLIALALAGSAITDVWFNGSLFASARAYFEARDLPDMDVVESDDTSDGDSPRWMRWLDRCIPDALVELFLCPYCFGHHAVLWPAFLCYIPALLVNPPWAGLFRLPIYILAAIRLSTVLEGVLPSASRIRRFEDIP